MSMTLRAPGQPVQAVHVLRQRPDPLEVPLHLDDDLMRPIVPDAATGLLHPRQILPRQLRVVAQHVARQRPLDGHAVASAARPVEPVAVAKGRQAGIHRDPRPRDEQNAPAGRQQIYDRPMAS